MEVLTEQPKPQAAVAPLDPQLATNALERLDLERPSARAELYFKLLQQLVWGALGLTAVYVLSRAFGMTPTAAQPIAVAAAVAYVLIVPVLGLNLEFFNQLRRAGVLKRRPDAPWTVKLQRKLAAERETSAVAHIAGIIGNVASWSVLVVGAFGLVRELFREPLDPTGLAVAVVLTAFGVALKVVPRMALGRERLRVIAELATGLHNGDPSAYDDVARFDRTQSARERERSLTAYVSGANAAPSRFKRLLRVLMQWNTGDDPATTNSYGYRQEPAFFGAKGALPPSVRLQVLAFVDRLVADASQRNAQGTQVVSERVEGTDLELSYCIDHKRREIRLISLWRSDTPEPRPIGPTDSGGTAYKVKLTPTGHASEQTLSPPKREAVEEALDRIAATAAEYDRLGTPLPAGQFVSRHPSKADDASVVVTYDLAPTDKTLNVVHVTTEMRAQLVIFVSYSHQDLKVFRTVLSFIQPLEKTGRLDIWFDGHLTAGERWREKIMAKLNGCHAALLLVSQPFITSKFISEVELPLLMAREAKGLKILWIPVSDSTVAKDTRLKEIQSLLQPTSISLEKHGQQGTLNEALVSVRSEFERALSL